MEATNGTGPSDSAHPVVTESAEGPKVATHDVDVVLAEVRVLAQGMQDARFAGRDLERTASRLLDHIDTLPSRIAVAISEALANQHRMIINDVRAAISELLEPES